MEISFVIFRKFHRWLFWENRKELIGFSLDKIQKFIHCLIDILSLEKLGAIVSIIGSDNAEDEYIGFFSHRKRN